MSKLTKDEMGTLGRVITRQMTVGAIYNMVADELIDTQPDWQRELVWSEAAKTRFIDTMLKGNCSPKLTFSYDYDGRKFHVIDGQQRIGAIRLFMSRTGRLANIPDVDPRLAGTNTIAFEDKTKPEMWEVWNKVQGYEVSVDIFYCQHSNRIHLDRIAEMYHRLNTGGTRLNNQEIRHNIFSGPFNRMLKDLSVAPCWTQIGKLARRTNKRYSHNEIILRLLTFHDTFTLYDGYLKSFLDGFMSSNRFREEQWLQERRRWFERTCTIMKKLTRVATHDKMNVTIFETIFVGASLNLRFMEEQGEVSLDNLVQELLLSKELSPAMLAEGISGKQRTIARFAKAKLVLSRGWDGKN